MTNFDQVAVSVGLRKLFPADNSGHFSILAFEALCGALGVTMSEEERRTLGLLHCVNYRDMNPGERQALFEHCMSILSRPSYRFPVMEAAPDGQILPALDCIRPGEEMPYRRRLSR